MDYCWGNQTGQQGVRVNRSRAARAGIGYRDRGIGNDLGVDSGLGPGQNLRYTVKPGRGLSQSE